MKTLAALIATLVLGSVAQAAAPQIKVFKNYDPETRKHEGVVVSTLAKPASLGLVFASINEDAKPNAACFAGEPQDGLKILGKMLEVMNAQEKLDVKIVNEQVVKRVVRKGDKDVTITAIKIEVSQKFDGKWISWDLFPQGIRQCL